MSSRNRSIWPTVEEGDIILRGDAEFRVYEVYDGQVDLMFSAWPDNQVVPAECFIPTGREGYWRYLGR